MADPYSILGIARGASEQDIKSAYRKLAKQFHPDANKDNPGAADRFSQITQAYDLLSDKDKRAKFDRGEIDMDGNPKMPFGYGQRGGGQYRQAGGNPFGGMGGGASTDDVDLSDLFEGIFGGGGQRRARGGQDNPFGGMGGGGMGGGGMGGGFAGAQRRPTKGANVNYRLAVTLTDIANLEKQRITLADGKTIDLKLPDGAEDGTQMRLAGKGDPGPAGNGDAIVTIVEQAHRFFRRDGDDVRLDLPITLDEAVNGAKIKVPTTSGAVMLTVSPGSSSGKVLRLKGKGFTRKDGSRGDQLVTLTIDLPEQDPELARRLEGWTDIRNIRSRLSE
ncbi:DnaJ C-terminal domain-containing protein [Croceicoccus marinus]|uniref:Molecular chaperone DnaJ n=1 Tax=Croceicoccus marinus TaxID=450378 RepID=A0A1Z1FEC7_9SPHN|nr:DnaJ C-terminal domain-containing protein [Croceicoccus marinus]ARU17047.1 molecular chaperone DnaJ [Croceicoccus marinus]